MSDAYPGGVDDDTETPPELSSDGELSISLNHAGISKLLERDNVPDDEVAFLYDVVDALDDRVNDGEMGDEAAAAVLEYLAGTVQDDVGIPDRMVLAERFELEPDVAKAAERLARPRGLIGRARATLARVVAP